MQDMPAETSLMRQKKSIIELDAQPPALAFLAKRQAVVVRQQAFPMLPESLHALDIDGARRITLQCIQATRQLAWVEQWFKKAALALTNLPSTSFIDKSETLGFAMDDLASDLLLSRAKILKMANRLEALGGPLATLICDTLRLSVQANADLFESVQAFKWAVMEHDYQADLVSGLMAESFSILQDLLARLKS